MSNFYHLTLAYLFYLRRVGGLSAGAWVMMITIDQLFRLGTCIYSGAYIARLLPNCIDSCASLILNVDIGKFSADTYNNYFFRFFNLLREKYF